MGGATQSRKMELIQPREPSSQYISLVMNCILCSKSCGLKVGLGLTVCYATLSMEIDSCRGYGQQDAQEFLCELLDKIQHELETTAPGYQLLSLLLKGNSSSRF